MEENSAPQSLPDDPSAERMLELLKKNFTVPDGEPMPDVRALGVKGDKKLYIRKGEGGQIQIQVCDLDESPPEGAREISWEQACEAFIAIRLNTEHLQKFRELEEKQKLLAQYQELARGWEELAAQREQLAREAERRNELPVGQARSVSRAGRKALFWTVAGAESVKASRAFSRWIKGGP